MLLQALAREQTCRSRINATVPDICVHDRVVFSVLASGRPTQDVWSGSYSNASGTITAVACGTLYNLRDLRQPLGLEPAWQPSNLSEICVRLYERDPQRFLNAINGKVAIALWDAPRQRLVLGRDRLGMEPLFYARHRSRLVFSSSLRMLLDGGWVPKQVEHEAIVQYLLYGYNPGAATLVQGVYKLPPGHLL